MVPLSCVTLSKEKTGHDLGSDCVNGQALDYYRNRAKTLTSDPPFA